MIIAKETDPPLPIGFKFDSGQLASHKDFPNMYPAGTPCVVLRASTRQEWIEYHLNELRCVPVEVRPVKYYYQISMD